MGLRQRASIAVLVGTVSMSIGCGSTCNDSCLSDADCDDEDLVCYSGHCAPRECDEECSNVGVNVCQFDRFCNYVGCG